MARIALVTAASRGIGGATARLAGKRGYKACVTYEVRLKHPVCNREEHEDRVFWG
jgi:NAD(P)-dependent dehydrogenase (short-subunit alcohol dehydrogenase family)